MAKLTRRFRRVQGLVTEFSDEFGLVNVIVTQKRHFNSATVIVEGPDEIIPLLEITAEKTYIVIRLRNTPIPRPIRVIWGNNTRLTAPLVSESNGKGHPVTVTLKLPAKAGFHRIGGY